MHQKTYEILFIVPTNADSAVYHNREGILYSVCGILYCLLGNDILSILTYVWEPR